MTATIDTVHFGKVQLMTERQARKLTDEIKGQASLPQDLLLQAYEGRAWSVLGYPSRMAGCAKHEFGMGQSHAYRLLDQGRVIRRSNRLAAVPPWGNRLGEGRP